MIMRTRIRRRARQRGISHTSNVLEAAMVMGWFVVLLLGEKAVSNASDARRYAESAAEESAVKSSASYCQAQGANVATAQANASTLSQNVPDVASAIAMVQALGCGQQRTFPDYTNPLKNVTVKSQSSAESVAGDVNPAGKQFEGTRDLGCQEKPLDQPQGSMDEYREKMWIQNLMGYK
jgi:hypothetical protein